MVNARKPASRARQHFAANPLRVTRHPREGVALHSKSRASDTASNANQAAAVFPEKYRRGLIRPALINYRAVAGRLDCRR